MASVYHTTIIHQKNFLEFRFDRILRLLDEDVNELRSYLASPSGLSYQEVKKIKYYIARVTNKETSISERRERFRSVLHQITADPLHAYDVLRSQHIVFTEKINPSTIRLQAKVNALRIRLNSRGHIPANNIGI